MKKYTFTALLVLFCANISAITLENIFPSENSEYTFKTIDNKEFYMLLDYAIENNDNIFELLNDLGIYLVKSNTRIHIKGETLREAEKTYKLGGDRIYAMLPIPIINDIYLGASDNNKPEFEVYINKEYSEYIEIGRIYLDTYFGFNHLERDLFLDPFGLRVKKMLMFFDLEKLHLFIKRKIAIHVNGISKPKKWVLKKIELKENI